MSENEIVLPKSGLALTRDRTCPTWRAELPCGEAVLYRWADAPKWFPKFLGTHPVGAMHKRDEALAWLDARVLELRAALLPESARDPLARIAELESALSAAQAAAEEARRERNEARSMIAESLPFLREAWEACFHGQKERLLSAEERGMGRLLSLFQAVADGKPALPPGVITRAEAAQQAELAIKWAHDLLGDPNEPHEAIREWCSPGLTAAHALKDAHAAWKSEKARAETVSRERDALRDEVERLRGFARFVADYYDGAYTGEEWRRHELYRKAQEALSPPAAPAVEGTTKPRVVCLCGSTRFWRSFMEWYGRLTDEGCIVLTIGRIVGKSEGELGEARKVALDELHLRKIDLADEVFVLDVDGYTGMSTKREIAHAEKTGKPVRYLSHEFPEYVEPEEPEFIRSMRRRDEDSPAAAPEPGECGTCGGSGEVAFGNAPGGGPVGYRPCACSGGRRGG